MPIRIDEKNQAPKYVQLADILRREIKSAAMRPGDRLPSLVELRARYGASQATAERAQAILEQEKLIVREPNRGIFVANPAIRQALGVIGIFTGQVVRQHPYYSQLFRGVEDEAHRAQKELLVLHEGSSIKWEKVDGVVICTHDIKEVIRRLPPGMPNVSMLYTATGVDGVTSNDCEGMGQAVEHLVELGHRRIAMLSAGDELSKRRREGYRDALRRAGIKPREQWVYSLEDPPAPNVHTYFREAGRESVAHWLARDWAALGCTALLAQNDEVAIGAIEAFTRAGIRVPKQVSVVGFDGTEISSLSRPPLTTIEVPLREIGMLAMKKLQQRIDQPLESAATPRASHATVPARLVVRDSTAPAAQA